MSKPNNPPAFGKVVSRTRNDSPANIQDSCAYITTEGGMTLRDYFAAKALTIMPLWANVAYGNLETWKPSDLASEAYQIADAMLAEREKGQQ